jgi:ABC-type multidrug transport system fused ATPase/permease subunit
MTEIADDPILGRLEDQIRWYGKQSQWNQRWYKVLKVVALVAAGSIPVLAAAAAPAVAAAALGALILAVESLQQLNQFQQNWISYRSTAESLKHEKYLYLAKAGPYQRAHDAHALLAVRIESLISQEHRRWQDIEEEAARGDPQAT